MKKVFLVLMAAFLIGGLIFGAGCGAKETKDKVFLPKIDQTKITGTTPTEKLKSIVAAYNEQGEGYTRITDFRYDYYQKTVVFSVMNYGEVKEELKPAYETIMGQLFICTAKTVTDLEGIEVVLVIQDISVTAIFATKDEITALKNCAEDEWQTHVYYMPFTLVPMTQRYQASEEPQK